MRLASLEFMTNIFSAYLCRLVLPSELIRELIREAIVGQMLFLFNCTVGSVEEKRSSLFLWQCITDRATNHASLFFWMLFQLLHTDVQFITQKKI